MRPRLGVPMPDPSSTSQPAEISPIYRPISALALTGLALSSLFAVMVVLNTAVALVKGEPFFLPGWVLGVAVVAGSTCLLAQLRIQNAEGTLAGLSLARAGLWLSVLLGATCYCYTWVTGLALTKQANDFLMFKSDDDTGLFPRLKEAVNNRSDFYQAFLLSLPLTSRGGSKAANEAAMLQQHDQPGRDGEGGNITRFRKHALVSALLKNPKAEIEPLGVVGWTYEKGFYHVTRIYRFSTPGFSFETAVAVQSTASGNDGEQRKWFFDVSRTPPKLSIKWTAEGEKFRALRFYSLAFVDKWRTELAQGTPTTAFNEADTDWSTLNIRPRKDDYPDHLKKAVGTVFRGQSGPPLRLHILTDENFADCRIMPDGRVEVVHPLRLAIPASGGFPNFNLELALSAQTKGPIDMSRPIEQPIFWEIRKITVVRAATAEKI